MVAVVVLCSLTQRALLFYSGNDANLSLFVSLILELGVHITIKVLFYHAGFVESRARSHCDATPIKTEVRPGDVCRRDPRDNITKDPFRFIN